MNERHRINYTKGGWRFVECALCGKRFNAGRPSNGPGIRWCNARRDDWWAQHTGQESPEVIHISREVELCPELKKEVQHGG